jgi:[acyl-carrier-protein] S-malonyltransferase
VEWLIANGVDTFVEIGSGSVLAGLIRKIDKTVKVIGINSLESVQAEV